MSAGQLKAVTFAVLDSVLTPYAGPTATLDDASALLPAGAYVTFRTYGPSGALHLDWHFDRLIESASIQGVEANFDRHQVRRHISEALSRLRYGESRVRLTLAFEPPGALYISVEEFHAPPPVAYEQGVACALAPRTLHRTSPRAKTTSFIAAATAARKASPHVNEVLLVGEDGAILEGSSSNFFALLDGRMRTADQHVLPGTTRRMILALAAEEVEVVLKPITAGDLSEVTEAFISSVSRGVLPVVEIDGRVIGDGRPGDVTKKILHAYHRQLQGEIEEMSVTRAE